MMVQHAWRPFAIISLALCMGTIGTALASPLYPLYQELWHLLPSQITYIFVAYMFGCLATLLFFGRASNSFGFLRTLQVGLIFVTAGLLLSALASHALWLGVGRFIIGIASGLISTSAMLGLMHTIPASHKAHAPQLSSIITVIGFSLGPFIGGAIAQFSSAPLLTPYLPIIAGAILCFMALLYLKSPVIEAQPFSIAPHLELPVAAARTHFFIAGLTAFSAFGAFSLFASLSASFVKDLIPWHGPLVSGLAISSILFISAAVQFSAKSLSAVCSLNYGLIFMLVSCLLLALCMYTQWSLLFVISDIGVGLGHGLGIMGSFGLIHQMTNSQNRAAVISTYLFMGYLGTIVPIVAVGYCADVWGLNLAVIGFGIGMALLCGILFFWHRQQKALLLTE
jgi:MFS family permease